MISITCESAPNMPPSTPKSPSGNMKAQQYHDVANERQSEIVETSAECAAIVLVLVIVILIAIIVVGENAAQRNDKAREQGAPTPAGGMPHVTPPRRATDSKEAVMRIHRLACGTDCPLRGAVRRSGRRSWRTCSCCRSPSAREASIGSVAGARGPFDLAAGVFAAIRPAAAASTDHLRRASWRMMVSVPLHFPSDAARRPA
ncbi:hypothetical protein NF700_11730 [Sphingomonadaceae bacterium OTU29MARTA1]|nr:hypothetical protein NF700_11730 [Sphingomonadaceae bacterium OTU29MARTA1]